MKHVKKKKKKVSIFDLIHDGFHEFIGLFGNLKKKKFYLRFYYLIYFMKTLNVGELFWKSANFVKSLILENNLCLLLL